MHKKPNNHLYYIFSEAAALKRRADFTSPLSKRMKTGKKSTDHLPVFPEFQKEGGAQSTTSNQRMFD